ncbi:hypothetical protein [Streptomyces sp. KR80]|uniref:hypothetical protein n=1 Tax=Streptomyces sp. KR80 TaxID=3457426 RepID=UPI003FD12965
MGCFPLCGEHYSRPFVDAELWAGKIARVLQEHPDGFSEEELVEETGLDLGQIEAGVMWQNIEFPALEEAVRREGRPGRRRIVRRPVAAGLAVWSAGRPDGLACGTADHPG